MNLRAYLSDHTFTDSTGVQRPLISSVSVGGKSGVNARICDFGWVLSLYLQCVEYDISFTFHQTGAKLRKGGREYRIPRELQVAQAKKAGLDFDGERMISWGMPIP